MPKHILILDDNPDTVAHHADILGPTRGKAVIHRAYDVATAIQLLETHYMDVIVLDDSISMTGDGRKIAWAVKCKDGEFADLFSAIRPHNRNAHFILVTADKDIKLTPRGVDELMHKPVRTADLLTSVQLALRSSPTLTSSAT